jgi:hypothetical protein
MYPLYKGGHTCLNHCLRFYIYYVYARRNSLVHEGETFSFELGALLRILEVYAQVMIDLFKEYSLRLSHHSHTIARAQFFRKYSLNITRTVSGMVSKYLSFRSFSKS